MAHKDPSHKAEYGRKRWAAMMADPVAKAKELARRRARQQERRARMTPEEHAAKKAKDKARRAAETPEQREKRLIWLRKFARSEKGLEARRKWRKKYNQTPEARARLEEFSARVRNEPDLYERIKANMREKYRKRREAKGIGVRPPRLTPEEKEQRKKIDWLRRQARAEHREKGTNIYLLFERWGCLLPKDLLKHEAATGKRMLTDEERLASLFERDAEAFDLRKKRMKQFELAIQHATPYEDLTMMERAQFKKRQLRLGALAT